MISGFQQFDDDKLYYFDKPIRNFIELSSISWEKRK